MNRDLFNAILAVDAYNRGYNAGVNISGSTIGNATIRLDATDVFGPDAQAVGFYAIAYNWGGGKIISYRGTNAPLVDAINGFGSGVGIPTDPQARLALDFYNAVREGLEPITLTGHSLGGGLAGFVAGLHGRPAMIFDNMAFNLAVSAAHEFSLLFPDSEFKQRIYGATAPWNTNLNGIDAFHLQGEFLRFNRRGQSPVSTQLSFDPAVEFPGPDNGILGGNLHSMSLLVLRMFAQQNTAVAEGWESSDIYFVPALFKIRGHHT
jgi:hypothetical protein